MIALENCLAVSNKVNTLYASEILFLVIYPRGMKKKNVSQKTCMRSFTDCKFCKEKRGKKKNFYSASFIIAQNWKHSKKFTNGRTD